MQIVNAEFTPTPKSVTCRQRTTRSTGSANAWLVSVAILINEILRSLTSPLPLELCAQSFASFLAQGGGLGMRYSSRGDGSLFVRKRILVDVEPIKHDLFTSHLTVCLARHSFRRCAGHEGSWRDPNHSLRRWGDTN